MRLINADEIKKREHDVVLANGAKHRCFDTTTLFEIPTIEAVPLEDYRSMEQTVHKLTQAIAEAEPKHGRWIPSDKGDCTYICSECGFVRDAYILEEKAFCPHCGADMREVERTEPEAEP